MVTLGAIATRSTHAAPTRAHGQSRTKTRSPTIRRLSARTSQCTRASPRVRAGGLRLEMGKSGEIAQLPGVETVLVALQRNPPAVHRPGKELRHRLRCGHRRGREVERHALDGGDHEVEIGVRPRIAGMASVHVLETQRDPALVVIAPEQARDRRGGRKRGKDPRLAAVDAGRVRVGLLADGFQEHPLSVAQEQTRRQTRRKALRLRDGLDHARPKPIFEDGPDAARDVSPVAPYAARGDVARERLPSAA